MEQEGQVLKPLLESISGDSGATSAQVLGWRQRLRDIHFSRWQSFAGVCFYVSVAGTTYAFGIYSDLLKTNLGFSQGGLDVIASVGNTGLYMSLLGGILLDRYGLHFVVYLGGLLIFIGFLYMWLAVEGLVPADILSVSIFFFLSQFGVCCHISSAVTSAVRLFPPEVRGSAVGLAKGYFGLSSAVLSDFSGGYFSKSKANFILFIAILIPIVGTIGVSLANFIPKHAVYFKFDERQGVETSLVPFFSHWICLFAVLLAVGYSQYAYEYVGYSSLIMPTLLGLTVLSVLLIPSYYGARTIGDEEWKIPMKHSQNDVVASEHLLSDSKESSLLGNSATNTYFGSEAIRDEFSCGSTDDDGEEEEGGGGGRKLLNDQRKSIIRNLSNQSNFTDFDVRVKMKDRRDLISSSSGSRYGYGSVISGGQKEDVEGSAGFKYSSHRHSQRSNSNGKDVDSEAAECFYGPSIPLSESFKTWRFWTLYIAFLTICGTGLMVIDNINAIAEAVGRHPSDFFVTLVSLANGAGRVSAGYASDRLSAYLSKLQFLSSVAAFMCLAQGMFALGNTELLYPSLLLVGYLFGCSVSLLAVNVADIFGPRFVATNFGAVDSAPIFGSYIFVTGIVALFYRTNTSYGNGVETCVGSDCFRIPFVVNSSCCFLVAILLLFMHTHTPMHNRIKSDSHP